MKRICTLSAVAFLICTGSFPCLADVIALRNGDRISGTLLNVGESTLLLNTTYAGEIKIQLEAVTGVTTDTPRFMRLKDGTTVSGVLQYDNSQHLITGENARSFNLESVEHMAMDKEALEDTVKRARKVWSGSLASGVTLRTGTKDTFDTTLDLTVLRKKPLHALTLKLSGAYGTADDVLNTQHMFGEVKWKLYPKRKRLYLFSLASGEHDKPRQLHLRTTLGGGLGYDFITGERHSLSAEFGIDYAREWWLNYRPGEYRSARAAAWDARLLEIQDLAAEIVTHGFSRTALLGGSGVAYRILVPDLADKTREKELWSARLSADYAQRIFRESELKNTLTILPSLDGFGEFRLTNSLAFSTPVTKSLDLHLNLQTEYDSDPGAPGVDKTETIFTTALRWRF